MYLRRVTACLFFLTLGLLTLHFYQAPFWNPDMLGYMGNALLHQTTDPVQLHRTVYSQVQAAVPPDVFDFLTGGPGQPKSAAYKRDRFINPYHYAELLPCFAIRPLYNDAIYRLSRTGLGLVRSIRAASAISYFLLGGLVYVWLAAYTPWAPLLSFLIMLTPPITLLGRNTGPDGLSILLGMVSLYIIFEREQIAAGIAILCIALWCRTDNIVLILPVLGVLWLQGRLEMWKTVVLAAIAAGSVLVINRAAGDYGIQMLYYRNFVAAPLAPGEMAVRFTPEQYAFFFFKGLKDMLSSTVPIYLVLGLIGLNRRTAPLLAIAGGYAALHYVILPNWIDRWMGIFYLTACLAAACQLRSRIALTKQQADIALEPPSRAAVA